MPACEFTCDRARVPNPRALPSDAAFKIIIPQGILKSVNEVVHEHELSGVYDCLRFFAITDRIPDTEKGVRSTAVLQITGKEGISELESCTELLGTVVKENSAPFDTTERSLEVGILKRGGKGSGYCSRS